MNNKKMGVERKQNCSRLCFETQLHLNFSELVADPTVTVTKIAQNKIEVEVICVKVLILVSKHLN